MYSSKSSLGPQGKHQNNRKSNARTVVPGSFISQSVPMKRTRFVTYCCNHLKRPLHKPPKQTPAQQANAHKHPTKRACWEHQIRTHFLLSSACLVLLLAFFAKQKKTNTGDINASNDPIFGCVVDSHNQYRLVCHQISEYCCTAAVLLYWLCFRSFTR